MQQDSKDRSANAKGLDAVRAEIDALDDTLLDLIERRLAISAAVAARKSAQDDGRLWLDPRREAAIIARLSEGAANASPEVIERIWRELMGASLQAQRPTEVVVPPEEFDRLAPLLRARFGSVAPLRAVADAEAALAAAMDGQAVAIVAPQREPLPEGLTAFDRICDGSGAIIAVAVGRIASDALPPE